MKPLSSPVVLLLLVLVAAAAGAWGQDVNAGANAIMTALRQKATAQLGQLFGAGVELLPVADGEMPFYYQQAMTGYNDASMRWVDRRFTRPVAQAPTAVPVASQLSADFADLLANIEYRLSRADATKLLQAETQTASTRDLAFAAVFDDVCLPRSDGTHPPAGMTVANYLLGEIVAVKWAGRGEEDPVTPEEIVQAAGNGQLRALLKRAPQSCAGAIDGPLTNYYVAMGSVLPLQMKRARAMTALLQLKQAIQQPTCTAPASGVQLAAPASSCVPAFEFTPAAADVLKNLQDGASGVSLTVTVRQESSSSMSLSVEGGAAVSVPIFDVFSVNLGGSAAFNQFDFSSQQAEISIHIKYANPTALKASPAVRNLDGSGWFKPSIVTEAFESEGKDTSSFHFIGANARKYVFHEEGATFAWLTGVLLTEFPAIDITYSAGNYDTTTKAFQQAAHIGVKLFGFIDLGGVSESYKSTVSRTDSSSSGFTIHLEPPQRASTDLFAQGAYPLSVTLGYVEQSMAVSDTLAAAAYNPETAGRMARFAANVHRQPSSCADGA